MRMVRVTLLISLLLLTLAASGWADTATFSWTGSGSGYIYNGGDVVAVFGTYVHHTDGIEPTQVLFVINGSGNTPAQHPVSTLYSIDLTSASISIGNLFKVSGSCSVGHGACDVQTPSLGSATLNLFSGATRVSSETGSNSIGFASTGLLGHDLIDVTDNTNWKMDQNHTTFGGFLLTGWDSNPLLEINGGAFGGDFIFFAPEGTSSGTFAAIIPAPGSVPEPTSILLLGGGLGGLFLIRGRQVIAN